jgi:hypothetical protein
MGGRSALSMNRRAAQCRALDNVFGESGWPRGNCGMSPHLNRLGTALAAR